MTEAEFSDLTVSILVPGLIGYMMFIIWKLAKDSQAGKFGMAMLFLVLGLGIVGFAAKQVIKLVIDV
jgi:hypothetical protein